MLQENERYFVGGCTDHKLCKEGRFSCYSNCLKNMRDNGWFISFFFYFNLKTQIFYLCFNIKCRKYCCYFDDVVVAVIVVVMLSCF